MKNKHDVSVNKMLLHKRAACGSFALAIISSTSSTLWTRLETTGTSPGIWILVYGLWTEDDSGLPTGPLTITKTLLKHFFDSLDSWTHSCPLSCFSDS